MDLRTLEVYSLEAIGRESHIAYLKENGQKVILKPADSVLDRQLINLLEQLDINGLPRVLGRTDQPSPDQIVFAWQEGQDIFSAKLTAGQMELILSKVLILMDKLEYFAGQNCFFLDLKASHILVKNRMEVGLIDFEHVFLSPETSVAWSDLEQIVGSQALTSKEITSGRLTLAHRDYSLAMIALSVVAQKPARELRKKHKVQAIKSFSPAWQEQLKKALNLEGFSPADLGLKLLPRNTQLSPVRELAATEIRPLDQEEPLALENIKSENELDWPDLLVQNLTFPSDEQAGIQERLLAISGLDLVGLCPCHGFPIRHEVSLALIPQTISDQAGLVRQILASLKSFSGRTMGADQLTKQLANLIVKQTKIADLFLSNSSQAACSWQTGHGSGKTTVHQVRYGRFAQENYLTRKLPALLDRAG